MTLATWLIPMSKLVTSVVLAGTDLSVVRTDILAGHSLCPIPLPLGFIHSSTAVLLAQANQSLRRDANLLGNQFLRHPLGHPKLRFAELRDNLLRRVFLSSRHRFSLFNVDRLMIIFNHPVASFKRAEPLGLSSKCKLTSF